MILYEYRRKKNAAAPGWRKYGKDMLRWMAPVSEQLIRSTGISSCFITLFQKILYELNVKLASLDAYFR
jgi:hypothetical protein